VIGYIEGSDPELKSELVVVGAHYDHIGTGKYGSRLGKKGLGKVHPGADDNASGTAGVMEIAEAFALSGAPPKRSLLFVGFSGEERGLLGANHYVRAPLFPLEKTVAMLNLDMISRGPEGVAGVTFVGTWAKWREVLQLANQPLELSLRLGSMGSMASDHAPFFRAKIPCLFFAAGLHPDYHTPGDTWQKVNTKTMAGITRLAYLTCEIVANVPERPVFTQPKSDRELPYLGITPGKEIKDMGFTIDAVQKGSPAEKGGLRKGDILAEFDGRQIRTFQDLRDALTMRKAGDEITLIVYRGGAEVELKVTLEKRGK
jgi:S1-C subfamily serine protease